MFHVKHDFTILRFYDFTILRTNETRSDRVE